MSASNLPPSIDQVCALALRLPCSPALLPRLAAALQRDDCTAGEIEAIIVVDPPLAAATLRLANSVFFGGSGAGRVLTTAEAVMRLGQREVYRIAALVLVERWDRLVPLGLSWEPGDFCRHALCTGLAAEVLAERTGRVDPAAAYTAGLLCDLGKLALAHACGNFYPLVRACCERTRGTWQEAEREVFGYDHAGVGGRLLREWHFPEELSTAAEFQAAPSAAPEFALPLLAHLHAAKYLATTLGPGVAEDGFLFKLHGEFLEGWGFSQAMLDASLPEVVQRAQSRLGDRLTHGALTM